MTSRIIPSPRVIVGIVGRTFFKFDDGRRLDATSNAVLMQAEEVATLLTKLQHIVLTGGTLFRPEISVKFRALRAAERAGRPDAIARSVGILPRDISDELTIVNVILEKIESNGEIVLYLHTMLSGLERDKVTGTAADVVIALVGERGTPREVAAAIGNDRPVVFLNSLKELAEATRRELDAQGHGRQMFPEVPLVATDPESAVATALRAVQVDSAQPKLHGALRYLDAMARWPRKLSKETRVLAQLHADMQLMLGQEHRRGLTLV